MNIVFVFLTFFVWSTSFSLGKVALQASPPLFLTGFRMLLGGLILLAFLFLFRRKDLRIKKHHLFPLFLLSLSSVYI
nr:S-adenosylmethionine/S-adenosylhomocysteine transporter [Chlamydiota bacterium]